MFDRTAVAAAPDLDVARYQTTHCCKVARVCRRFASIGASIVTGLLVAACGQPSPPAFPGAALSGTEIQPQHPVSVIAPYSRLRPAAPQDWRERNERVAPGTEQ